MLPRSHIVHMCTNVNRNTEDKLIIKNYLCASEENNGTRVHQKLDIIFIKQQRICINKLIQTTQINFTYACYIQENL